MKKNETKTTRNDINTVNISGSVSHVKSYKTKDSKDLVKGLIKSENAGHYVSVPFTIWDAIEGIPEDGDLITISGELSCSSYEKDGKKIYSTFISVNSYRGE